MSYDRSKSVKKRIQFGVTIRELRGDLGYSQEKFATKCGLHRTYMGGIERGERNLALDNIIRIAAALDMKASELFERAKL